jgi:beta-lactamase class A
MQVLARANLPASRAGALAAAENRPTMRLDEGVLRSISREAGLKKASAVVLSLDGAAPTIALRAGEPLYPASMIKVPLAAVMLATITDLKTLETRVAVTAENMTINDAPSPLEPGYEASWEELLRLAIVRSDNVATNVLYDVLGRERATRIVRERFGLEATAFYRKLSGSEPRIADPQWDGIHRNSHPAADAAKLFTAIARDEVPYAALLRDMLAAQEWNDKLSLGLQPGDRFLHKTGDTDEVTHDGGILIAADGCRYVVVVYTKLPSTPEHNARFGPFMRELRALL